MANKLEVEVYRDIEKFYKVLGYYDGQELKPLERLESHIDQNLETSLRNEDVYIRRLQYQLNMLEAICEGKSVFQTDKPESSLTYALFSEGIQNLAILRDLSAVDLKEWAELVRRTLIDFDEGKSNKDLASVLWRSPSRNIRCKVYNALLDLDSTKIDEKKEPKENKEVPAATSPTTDWHHRDQEWDVPDGNTIDRKHQKQLLQQTSIKEAKNRISSLGMNPLLPVEFQLDARELDLLSEELGAFDQNHVDFNSLHWLMHYLNKSTNGSPQTLISIQETLKDLTKSIVARFHPGLILLLMKMMKTLDATRFSDLQLNLEKVISQTLQAPINEKRLLASLKHAERSEVTKQLLPYLDIKQFPRILSFYISEDDPKGLKDFLLILIQRHPENLGTLFFSWGEDLLSQLLPHLKGISFSGKADFLQRALRSHSQKVQYQAIFHISEIQVKTDSALETYASLSDESKELWLQQLLTSTVQEPWKAFISKGLSTSIWLQSNSKALAGKIQITWIKLSLHYFGGSSWKLFQTWISTRRFWLWAEFPELRDLILTQLLLSKAVRDNPEFREICSREAKLKFQNELLRIQLQALARQK